MPARPLITPPDMETLSFASKANRFAIAAGSPLSIALMSACDCAAIATRAGSCRAAPATPKKQASEAKKTSVEIEVGAFMVAHWARASSAMKAVCVQPDVAHDQPAESRD